MTVADWNELFGNTCLINLTDEERQYLALAPLSPHWDSMTFCSKTNLWYSRLIAYFDGDTIVKCIEETKRVDYEGVPNYELCTEYDTRLYTTNRQQLLPLTSRGKPKPLTATNIRSVTAFGCGASLLKQTGKDTGFALVNRRANKQFPIGEAEAVARIQNDADFHDFMRAYMDTCREDYFDKLRAFHSAGKVTVRYQPGDIFRMELDRTHYCYGLITGSVKQIKAIPELPPEHSMRCLMMVPILVRPYGLITEDPNLSPEQLRQIPLGRMDIVADNDILWGTHTIVGHKELAAEDLEFHLICSKILSRTPHTTLFTQDLLMETGLLPQREYRLYIEWGFAQTELPYDRLSDRLKTFLLDYSSPHGGVSMGIDPRTAVPDEKRRGYYDYRMNLLNPHNRELRNEIFACLGLEPDTDFDQFAKAFGGLTKQQILDRMK